MIVELFFFFWKNKSWKAEKNKNIVYNSTNVKNRIIKLNRIQYNTVQYSTIEYSYNYNYNFNKREKEKRKEKREKRKTKLIFQLSILSNRIINQIKSEIKSNNQVELELVELKWKEMK